MEGGRVCPGTSVQLQVAHVLLDPVLLGVGTDFAALLSDKPVGCKEASFQCNAWRGTLPQTQLLLRISKICSM